MDFKQEVVALLKTQIDALTEAEIEESIEVPKYTHMGDFAFPCFKLSKAFRKAPNMIATEIASNISNDAFEGIEAAGPYINFTINKAAYAKDVIEHVLDLNDDFGKQNIGNNDSVIVEFSSVNIAKVMHIGHIRSAMIGNSLARIYKALNYNVTRINHLGDYGTQFGKMILAYKLWGDRAVIEQNPVDELVKLYVKFHDEADKDDSLNDQAREWFLKLEQGDAEATELWQWMKDFSMVEFNRVYELLNCEFDSFAGESFYSDKMPAILTELREKNIVKKDDGAEIVDLEPYGMPPCLITKRDGSSLYVTRDIAAAVYRKKTYDFKKNIYVVGAEQKLHFQQWMQIVKLMGYDWADDCVHVPFGLVSMEDGAMSTRKGRVVKLEEVLLKAKESILEIIEEKNPTLDNKEEVAKQVGVGAIVFQELFHNRIKDYVFSWERMLSSEGETGPYVQYSHARACSLMRNIDVEGIPVDYSLLNDEASMEVVRHLSKFEQVIQDAARKYEPSILTRYICSLAQLFNSFYNANRISDQSPEIQAARMALVKAVKITLKNGLYLVTIDAPERL
ncbi:MAG: arginine--tRNA ligase [Clostridia bacterium]|nr:arginine--tRNA ligase [Clostridia bacterium]